MRFSHLIVVVCALFALSSVCLAQYTGGPPGPNTQPVTVKAVQQYTGSVPDVTLMVNTPDFIADAAGLRALWTSWKLTTPLPDIDFTKMIASVAVSRGAQAVNYIMLVGKGDVRTAPGMPMTDPPPPGFRYTISTIVRDGIKTFNQKPVPLIKKIVLAKTELLAVAEISGTVDDVALMADAPKYILDDKSLQDLWAKWKITDKMPVVDFKKQIALIVTVAGGVAEPAYFIDSAGNIGIQGTTTTDESPGFHYTIAVVSSVGAKSIFGNNIPYIGPQTPSLLVKGSIDDEALMTMAPSFIVDATVLDNLAKKWDITDKIPYDLDFDKKIVVISTSASGDLKTTYKLDATGNISIGSSVSIDFDPVPGFRYVIAVLNREGIKTISGKPIPVVKKLTPAAQVSGSKGADEMGQLGALQADVITVASQLNDLWRNWNINDNMPTVDFQKQAVIISVTPGSQLAPTFNLDEKGNLIAITNQSKDMQPGFRYVISVINMEGVKSINGRAIPRFGVQTPVSVYNGTSNDQLIMTTAPPFFARKQVFSNFWTALKTNDKMPDFDENTQVAIFTSAQSSELTTSYRLDTQGNIEVVPAAKTDPEVAPVGFRYIIAVLSKAGIKSVNGKPLR